MIAVTRNCYITLYFIFDTININYTLYISYFEHLSRLYQYLSYKYCFFLLFVLEHSLIWEKSSFPSSIVLYAFVLTSLTVERSPATSFPVAIENSHIKINRYPIYTKTSLPLEDFNNNGAFTRQPSVRTIFQTISILSPFHEYFPSEYSLNFPLN